MNKTAANVTVMTRLSMITALAAIILSGGCGRPAVETDPERYLETSAKLEARELYAAALDELVRYRATAGISREEEANVLYKMGKLADEKLDAFDRALAYYTMATVLNPRASWYQDAEKRSVRCMEAMGRSTQAQALLRSLTGEPAPDKEKEVVTGTVVAVVDGHSLTWEEVLAAERLRYKPEDLENMETRRQLVHEYVFTYMLAQEAKRKGIDQREDIKQVIDKTVREILSGAVLGQEVGDMNDEKALKEYGQQLSTLHGVRIFDDNIPKP